MTEQEQRISSLKDNIVMAVLAVVRNLDAIIAFDDRPIKIEIASIPYQDSRIDFHRYNIKPEEQEDPTTDGLQDN